MSLKAARALCAIDGCDREVLARGWCGKHYSRWNRAGDPLYVHPRLKEEPNAPSVDSRYIRGQLVFFTATGRAFVETRRVRKGERTTARRYGWVITCETCKREAFVKSSGANRIRFCSHKCAGPASRNSKLGRTRKATAKSRIDTMDRLFSALVRADGKCVHCSSTVNLQCAHGFGRRYRRVRWDCRNAFCLCQRCHLFFTHRPLEWDDWLRQRWGESLYDELRSTALGTDPMDLDAVRDRLVAQILDRDITVSRLPKSVRGWIGLGAA